VLINGVAQANNAAAPAAAQAANQGGESSPFVPKMAPKKRK